MSKIDQYRDLLIRLLPKGKIWQSNPDSSNTKIYEGFAVELSRVDDRAEKLLREQDPRLTVELLPEWEKEFGLPDECSVLGSNIEERRTNLIAKMLSTGGQSPQYFIDLFAAQGLTIQIEIKEPTYVPLSIPAEITGDAHKYMWFVTIPDFQIDYMEIGDHIGDYLGEFQSSNNVACIIEKRKPAYTKAVYIYGV